MHSIDQFMALTKRFQNQSIHTLTQRTEFPYADSTKLTLNGSGKERLVTNGTATLGSSTLNVSLAAGYLRGERPGHTLQATALVHEAYLRLVDVDLSDFSFFRACFNGPNRPWPGPPAPVFPWRAAPGRSVVA